MTYTITKNAQYNSTEVTFDGKPCEAVRTALKALKMRWHGMKKCWYGYAGEHEVRDAILNASAQATEAQPDAEAATVVTDGYMGGGAVYGSKSNRALYGADLSAAIRADLKAAGVKGVTVSCKTYSGGQSITARIKAPASWFVPRADFVANYQIPGSAAWIQINEHETVFARDYWEMDATMQKNIRLMAANYEYDRYTSADEIQINEYHIAKSTAFLTDEARQAVERVNAIICAYRFDESNSMVDYFHTNFYYDIRIRPEAAALAAAS